MHTAIRRLVTLAFVSAFTVVAAGAGGPARSSAADARFTIVPLIGDWVFVGADANPPSQAACAAVRRRCFNPAAMANSYDYAVLHAAGHQGQGKTIVVVDSFGATTVRSDLAVFNTAFGLPHMCGETGPSDPSANCASNASPRFDIVCVQGCPTPKPPPPSSGTGQEAHNLWDLEVALDVEWAHATAPLANIVLLTTPTAETLGVQGLQQMMDAEAALIDAGSVDVISQSFGTGEGAFNNGLASLKQLRTTFEKARAHKVTVFASSGDGGTTNSMKVPVKNPRDIPYPSVIWPASDPLVTAVGGTYLCTNAETGAGVDSASPPVNCQNAAGDREPGWVVSGGGYSIYFDRPGYQSVLPLGSTYVGSSAGAPGKNTNMRGIPDIAYQASARTGVLVYLTEPDTSAGSAGCGGASPCSTGWYVVGGTSASAPQWAGLVALADEIAGHDLGFINPALYRLANNAATYAADFYDVTRGNNGGGGLPGYDASKGWDAVTGLGTPDAAKLIPDLIAEVLPTD
jgi:subtilase family serine protease